MNNIAAAAIVLPEPDRPRTSGPCDHWFGAPEMSRWSAAVAPPVPLRVHRQAILVSENAPAQSLYIVQAGDFKVSRVAEDGYEQVLEFASASDVLGLDGLASGRSLVTIEALQDSNVYAIPVADLRVLRASNPSFDARLQAALSAQWGRLRDMAWLMAAVGADRRTARFLLQLSRRMSERGMSPRHLRLQMSRRDIAAHIGLAHESVSRAMTALAGSGYLRVYARDVEIVDMAGLQQLASSTRGHAAEPACERPAGPDRRLRAAQVAEGCAIH